MDLLSSKQNLLKNLQGLPNPSSSEALLSGRPSAVASSMAANASSTSRKKNLPSVLQPKAKVVEKSLEQALELLANSILHKFTLGPLEDRRVSISLYDKDGVLLLANQFIEVNPHYSLPTLILALQTLLDEVCARNPRKYPNSLLVRAIEVRYFNDEKYAGLPRITAILGGDEVDQEGKVAEFVQWKENMVCYWERFRRVMLVGAEAEVIEVPILKVRTVEMITDWDGPHGVEVIGNGHAFGDTLMPKRSPEPGAKELAEDKEVLYAAMVLNDMRFVDASTERNNNEFMETTTPARNNMEFLEDTITQRPFADPMNREQAFDDNNVQSPTAYTQTGEVINTEMDPLVACIQEELERIGNPQSFTVDEINHAVKTGRSVSPADGWMIEADVRQSPPITYGSSYLNRHIRMVRGGFDRGLINIKGGNEAFNVQKADTWEYYQRMGGDSVMRNLFKLDHMPFVPRPAPSQDDEEGDISIEMVPYRNINFTDLYPAETERIIKFREYEEAAEGFDSEDDDTYAPDGRRVTSIADALFNPFIMKARNRKEVQAGLAKVLDGAINRRASANHSAYLESLAVQGTSGMSTPTGNVSDAARIEAARTLSAMSTPFVPLNQTRTPPDNQMNPYDAYTGTPTPQQAIRFNTSSNIYSSHMQGLVGSTNSSFPFGGMNSLFTTQEDYDAYQRVATADAYKQEDYPEQYGYNFGTLTNAQAAGTYDSTSFNYQGMDAYGTDGCSSDKATGSNYMDTTSKSNFANPMDDMRGIVPNPSYMTSSFTPRPKSGYCSYDGYGSSYTGSTTPNHHQHGFNNPYAGIDLNSSLATAFNGNTNQDANNLQVPHSHGSSSSRKSWKQSSKNKSRKNSRIRNATATQVNSAANRSQAVVIESSMLRAESPSFAPGFKSNARMYQEFAATTASAIAAGQGEANPFLKGVAAATAAVGKRTASPKKRKQ